MSELLGCALGRQPRAMGSILGHRLERIRGSEHADGGRLLPRSGATVVPGSVEPFVVHPDQGREVSKRARCGEDALGVVRMHSDLFPLA